MAWRYSTIPTYWIKDFSGGLNNRFRSNRIADNESPALRNARFSRFGALSKRLGTARKVVNVTDMGALASLFSYRLQSMSNEQILISDGDVYARATAIGTYTSVVTGMTATFAPEFLSFNGLIYITNGRDTVRTLNGSNTASTDANFPISKFAVIHKGRIFTANQDSDSNPSRLQWSDVGSSTWTSTNFEDISPDDGGGITGIISFGDELIVFKGPNVINSITSNTNYSNSRIFRVLGDIFSASNPSYFIDSIPLPPGVGLLGHRSIQIYNGILIFATNDGFYAYLGGGKQPIPISESIRGEINNWELGDIQAYTRKPAAIVWKNKYYCSLYNDGDSADLFSNRIYVYEDGKWWVDIISATSDDFTTDTSTGTSWCIFNNTLYSGSSFSNILREWDTASAFSDTTDANSAASVNMSYATKEFDFEEEQNFEYCFVHLRRQSSGTLTFEFNIDQRGAVSTSVDMTTPDTGDTANTSSNILRKRVNIDRQGRSAQFRFYDSGANDAEIYAIELKHDRKNYQYQ